MAVEDYPTLPALPEETGSLPRICSPRRSARSRSPPAATTRLPMLTGIRVEISGETVVLAATDRFRLAVRELTWSTESADIEAAVLVPAKTLAEAAKTGADGSDVRLSLGAGRGGRQGGPARDRGNGKRSTTRLLDAEFPKFRQLFPAEHTAVATIEVAELTEAIKRVALVADRGAQVRMEFADDVLRLSAGADDVGRAEEDLRGRLRGRAADDRVQPDVPDRRAGFVALERVTFGFTTPASRRCSSGAVTPPPAGTGPYTALPTDYVYLLMPVRLPG